jgi:hypothetical protein
MSSVAKHLLPFPIPTPSFYPVSIYQPLLTPLMVLLPKPPLGRNAESFRMGLCCGHIQAYSLMFRSTSGVRQPAIWHGKRFPKLSRVDSKTLGVAFSQADLCDKCLTSSPKDFDVAVAIPEHVVHRTMPRFLGR